jgi:hypothetical protein
MFKGEYKTKTAQGTPITYMIGDSVVYQGKVYTAVNQTQKSPLQSPKDWKYTGLTEPVQGSSSPLLPEENQFWVDQSNNLYIRKDGSNPVWQQISGGSGASGPVADYVSYVNGFSGGITLAAGEGITVSNSLGTITISSTTFINMDGGNAFSVPIANFNINGGTA